jgi:hypothetical protein
MSDANRQWQRRLRELEEEWQDRLAQEEKAWGEGSTAAGWLGGMGGAVESAAQQGQQRYAVSSSR